MSSATYNPADYLDLYDFRMRVLQMYRERRQSEGREDPNVETRELRVGTSGEGAMPMRRVALARRVLQGGEAELTVYWIDVYGGGLFLSFRDATSSGETYFGKLIPRGNW